MEIVGHPATESWFTKDAARNIIYQSLKIQRLGPNLNQEFWSSSQLFRNRNFTCVRSCSFVTTIGVPKLKTIPSDGWIWGCLQLQKGSPMFSFPDQIKYHFICGSIPLCFKHFGTYITWQVQIGNAKWNEDQMTLQGHLRWRPHGINYGLLWCEVGTHSSHMVVVPNLRF